MLNDVEAKIVGAGKRPNRDRQERGGLQARMFQQQDCRRQDAQAEEQGALEVKQPGIPDIGHRLASLLDQAELTGPPSLGLDPRNAGGGPSREAYRLLSARLR